LLDKEAKALESPNYKPQTNTIIMSIVKSAGISLGILAIVGGGSLAVISASAKSGRMFDTNAISFIQSGDLAGYRNYLIGQETTRINAIDQAQFTKIQARTSAQKPLMDLTAKYEPQLTTLATNKDQAGFVTLFKQYQTEAKPLMDAQRTANDAQEATESSSTATNSTDARKQGRRGNKGQGQNGPKTPPTDAQLTDMATKTYTKAIADIAAGKTFKLGFGGRGSMMHGSMMGMKGGFGGMHNEADEANEVSSQVK
jgi:hypothetical protein